MKKKWLNKNCNNIFKCKVLNTTIQVKTQTFVFQVTEIMAKLFL